MPDDAGNKQIHEPIPAAYFYKNDKPHGSSRTTYVPPTVVSEVPYRSTPPTFYAFNEPQDDEPIPELVSAPDSTSWGNDSWGEQNTWVPTEQVWESSNWGSSNTARKIIIEGRSNDEELRWFDAELRARCERPGPGVLPPVLSDILHDPEHTLYSVSVAQPLPMTMSPQAPTADEVRTAIPHPHAYYCREHNGWVLILWRSSSVLPPLERPLELPDMARRKKTSRCVGGEQPFGQANTTHHWHTYERAVDARKLNPPFHGEDEVLLDLHVCCQCSMYCMSSDVIPGVIPVTLVEELTRDKLAHPTLGRTPKASVLTGWETVLTIIENRLWKGEVRILPVTRPRFQSKIGWNATIKDVFAAVEFLAHTMHDSPTEEIALSPPEIEPSTPEGKHTRAKLLRAWIEVGAWLAVYNKSSKDGLGEYKPLPLHVNVDSSAREEYQTAIGAHVSQIPRGLLHDSLLGVDALDPSWRALGMTPSSYSWELLAFAYLAQCRCDPAHTMFYYTHLSHIVLTMHDSGGGVTTELQSLLLEERERNRYTLQDFIDAGATLGFGKENELGMELDADVDDTFVLEAWRDKRKRAWKEGDRAVEIRRNLNDALHIIADDRASAVLQKAWEEERGSGMSPEAAYSTLEVPRDMDETMLLTVFNMRVEDQPSQGDRMREALTVIAEVTESERLRQFLATGRDPGDSTLSTAPEMPRGLNQLGNTCYLNSLLQYFYTIKDLRDAITPLVNTDVKSLDDSKVTDDDLKRHRVGGRLVTRREILRSKKFVGQLADLFWNLEYCEVPAVTPTIDLAKLALVTSQDEEEDDQDHERTGTDSSNDTDATLVEDAPGPRSTYDRSSNSPPPLTCSDSILGKRPRDTASSMDVDASSLSPQTVDSPVHSPTTVDPRMLTQPYESVASSSKLQPPEQTGDVEMRDETEPFAGPKAPPLPPRKPRPVDDSVMMFGRQHDVSECMDNCIFQIETALLDFQEMANAEEDKTSIVKRLFYGKKRQRLTPLNPSDDTRHKSSIHEKEDLFSHLHINVSGDGFDLYDGLSRYFDDVVELDGQKKRMAVSLVDVPPLLQIQLQRAQFDRETQQAYKSQAYVKFGETIYMDRFLESADPEKKVRAKAIEASLTASRDRLQRLTQDKHAPFAPALGSVADFLAAQDILQLPEVDEDLATRLRNEQSSVTAQIDSERNNAVQLKAQLEDVWKNDTSAAYELTTVFIHRGSSPSWGHYFLYSRHLPDNPDKWFKYNDSDVSIVSKDEVLTDTTSSTANPYMLVFARRDCEAIETVHRFNPETLQDG
ncbi:cysteine proteinase [Sparassis latifolia]